MLDYDGNKPNTRFMPAVRAFAARGALLEDQSTLCDFKLVCKGVEWPVHRAVLLLQSAVLEKACAGSFEEAEKARLDLSDEEIPVVAGLVHFMYKFNYDYDPYPRDAGGEQPDGPLTFHVKIFMLADYLNIAPLKMLATEKFKEKLKEGLSAASMLDAADIEQAAVLAYKTRAITKSLCVSLVAWLVLDAQPFEPESRYHQLEKVVRALPDLAVDMISAMQMVRVSDSRPTDDVDLYRCISCNEKIWADVVEEGGMYFYNFCGDGRYGYRWIEDAVNTEKRTGEDAVKRGDWWRE